MGRVEAAGNGRARICARGRAGVARAARRERAAAVHAARVEGAAASIAAVHVGHRGERDRGGVAA